MSPAFVHHKGNKIEWLTAPNLTRFPWLLHAFTTRVGGVRRPGLDLGTPVGRSPASITRNRRLLLSALRAEGLPLAAAHQIHSADIVEVLESPGGRVRYRPAGSSLPGEARIPRADALVTTSPHVLLSVRTADCLPVLLVDPHRRAVAAVHAGWRGALKRIAEKAVGEMRRLFGTTPGELFAALGPAIGPCCYEVGEEVIEAFTAEFARAERYFREMPGLSARRSRPAVGFSDAGKPPGCGGGAGSGRALDVTSVVRDQLLSAGVPLAQVEAAGLCTACHPDWFFSYRREGSAAGRMMPVIGIMESAS